MTGTQSLMENDPDELSNCGCCEGLEPVAPVEIFNRPGLSTIRYRTGTHASFKRSLLARLSGKRDPQELRLALRSLNTRDDDDFSIALLDAWAMAADVLTFYQERIANESYLRTAVERLSILQMARLIGYELRPGVAASTYLAFTMEEAPGMPPIGTPGRPVLPGIPTRTTIDVGTKVQSVPHPGEQPQLFEAIEKIEARVPWNNLHPRLTQAHPLDKSSDRLVFEGLVTSIKPGDGLLAPLGGDEYLFALTAEVIQVPETQTTEVKLTHPANGILSEIALPEPAIPVPLPGSVISQFWNGAPVRASQLEVLAQAQGFQIPDVFTSLEELRPPAPLVYILRTRAAIFGHNSPPWGTLPASLRTGELIYIKSGSKDHEVITQDVVPGPYVDRKESWADTANLDSYPGETQPPKVKNIYLDSLYPTISRGSWIVLRDGSSVAAFQIGGATEITKADFTLSAKVSRLTLADPSSDLSAFGIRSTTVHGQPEALTLARLPVETPLSGTQIDLDGWVDGLRQGQAIMVCGELQSQPGVYTCEAAKLEDIEHIFSGEGFTRVKLSADLKNTYILKTVTINANIARATHGETVREVLGSGNAGQPFQGFVLRQPPLTYISSQTASGAASTLEIRVNDVRWQEVPSFYGHDPSERIYITRTTDDGRTVVQFGDGRTGARLPNGQDNVRATYRRGTGLAGLVEAEQINLLMSRPLGLKGATNPLAPDGAADRESRDEARRNAPLTVLTLERIVSLQDYEDFARSFAGIAKSLATWTWTGQRREVFVTVAGPNGAEIKSGSDLLKNLIGAIQKASDPLIPLRVQSYRRVFFKLAAYVKVDPDYLPEKVLKAVEDALRTGFSFDIRSFGQPVTFSEITALIQAVPGVIAANLTKLYRSDGSTLSSGAENTGIHLAADLPRLDANGSLLAAELLMLDPAPMDELGEML